ncbi:MAG: DUF3179 domain-containing (seleno)protein, partial [Halobacteria archaeon]|nr:DUF3179 domain-containing (seleno)protein [Halobacteria archaeon]
MHKDDTYPKKHIVMGARTSDGAVAFEKDALRNEKVIAGDVSGTTYTAFYDDRLDTAYVYEGDGSNYEHQGNGSYTADGETVEAN